MSSFEAGALLLDIPLAAFALAFVELAERDAAALRSVCRQLQALVDACVQALDVTALGDFANLRFSRLQRLATHLCLKLPEVRRARARPRCQKKHRCCCHQPAPL
jgi:hypothetical protein